MSKDTSELQQQYEEQKGQISQEIRSRTDAIQVLENKAADLEDQSRRHNLIFYNIPEKEKGWEDCEKLLDNIIIRNNLYDYGGDGKSPQMDRAHRLGKKDPSKPEKIRPVIVKFTHYNDKELVLNNRSRLQDVKVNGSTKNLIMSEDYCKKTVDLHKLLLGKAKVAKEANSSIAKYYINYKSITLSYDIEGRDTYFKKTYVLKDMYAANWHVLTAEE